MLVHTRGWYDCVKMIGAALEHTHRSILRSCPQQTNPHRHLPYPHPHNPTPIPRPNTHSPNVHLHGTPGHHTHSAQAAHLPQEHSPVFARRHHQPLPGAGGGAADRINARGVRLPGRTAGGFAAAVAAGAGVHTQPSVRQHTCRCCDASLATCWERGGKAASVLQSRGCERVAGGEETQGLHTHARTRAHTHMHSPNRCWMERSHLNFFCRQPLLLLMSNET